MFSYKPNWTRSSNMNAQSIRNADDCVTTILTIDIHEL